MVPVYNAAMRIPASLIICPALLLALSALAAAQKSSSGVNINKAISGTGTYAFVGLGILLPLVQDGDQGFPHFLRAGDATTVAVGLSLGLEQLIHENRPNGRGNASFPSTHTTAAFAIATMQAQYHPTWEAPLWYLGASVIGVSRVQLREHHWGDVFAGAALGWGTARLELSSHRGLLISPFFDQEGDPGLAFTAKF
jgi:membrane-associated phospholipid phosphatase